MEQMNTDEVGYVCGLILDSVSEKTILNADISSPSSALTIVEPFKEEKEGQGIYFATGDPGIYRINVSANGYQSVEIKIRILNTAQERHIYLDFDTTILKQSI